MTIRSDISIDWGMSPRIIEVMAPSVVLTIQDLYDTLRSLGAIAIDEPEITDGSGKEVLSTTEMVGLTVTLLNAKVKFEDRISPTDCIIYGGNLVAMDEGGYSMNPIEYATYVTVSYAKSSSATLVQAAEIAAVKLKTDNIPDNPAIEASVQTALDRIGVSTSTVSSDLDYIEAAISVLPEDPADESLVEAAIGTRASKEDTDAIKALIAAIQSGGNGFSI